jgi:hypothetical protein
MNSETKKKKIEWEEEKLMRELVFDENSFGEYEIKIKKGFLEFKLDEYKDGEEVIINEAEVRRKGAVDETTGSPIAFDPQKLGGMLRRGYCKDWVEVNFNESDLEIKPPIKLGSHYNNFF